jgi:hypothetical protein
MTSLVREFVSSVWVIGPDVVACFFLFVMQLCVCVCVYQLDGLELQRSNGHPLAVLCGPTAYNCIQITSGVVLITQMCYLLCGTLHRPRSSFVANRNLRHGVCQKAIRGLLTEPES